MTTPIKVFILEDMLSFIDGFQIYVDRLDHIKLIDSANNEQLCLSKTRNRPLDIILIDIVIGRNAWSGFTVAEEIISRFRNDGTDPAIIFLTAHAQQEYVEKAKSLNCSFVNKYLPMPEIIQVIEQVYDNNEAVVRSAPSEQALGKENKAKELALYIRESLTPKQGQIAVNLYFHWNNAEIAEEFGISKATVETHLKKAYEQLDLKNDPNCREKLKKMVYESGLVNYIDSINKEPKKWFKRKMI